MPTIAVKNVLRPDPALLQRLGQFGVATVHEAQGRTGLLAPYLRPIYPGAKASGSVLTVLAHPGDNTMLHVAAEVSLAPPGLKTANPTAASASPPSQHPAVAAQSGPTAWLMVFLAIFAGILAATQVGKVHIALPAIRSDLALSLVAGSWLISSMNFLGLFGASLVGVLAARYGSRRFITLGLVVLAAFGFYGSTATSEMPLVISRFFEGVGFMMVIIGAPSLIAAVTQEKDRRLALGAWGAFMPGGIALATWLAPSVMAHAGWRGLWAWGGGAAAGFCPRL